MIIWLNFEKKTCISKLMRKEKEQKETPINSNQSYINK